MKRKWKYNGSDGMGELVENNYRVLLVMSRFGIGLGFGERSIGEVCQTNGVDTETFLAVVNLTLDEDTVAGYDVSKVSPGALLDYLIQSHDYFLRFRLPAIREDLIEVLGNPADDLTRAVIRYFDEYVDEMRRHTQREDKTLFPHVRSLMQGKRDDRFRMGDFHQKHDRIQARLAEFKRVLIKYYPARSTNHLNSVLFDIYNCENDLVSHNRVEDILLVPLIAELERQSGG